MATAQQLADRALAIAERCLDSHRDELASLAGGDTELLRLAAARVRAAGRPQRETERTAEHMAFSLLTAAFAELVRQRGAHGATPLPF